jgi:hypothetical protein
MCPYFLSIVLFLKMQKLHHDLLVKKRNESRTNLSSSSAAKEIKAKERKRIHPTTIFFTLVMERFSVWRQRSRMIHILRMDVAS